MLFAQNQIDFVPCF